MTFRIVSTLSRTRATGKSVVLKTREAMLRSRMLTSRLVVSARFLPRSLTAPFSCWLWRARPDANIPDNGDMNEISVTLRVLETYRYLNHVVHTITFTVTCLLISTHLVFGIPLATIILLTPACRRTDVLVQRKLSDLHDLRRGTLSFQLGCNANTIPV